MRHQRGTLLVAILPLAVLVGGFVLLSTTSARAYLEEHEVRRYQLNALNEANAALSIARARIKSSAYTSDKNDVLRTAVDSGEATPFNNTEGSAIRVLLIRDDSEVWVSELSAGWFQMDVVASVGGRRTHVRSLVRERDPFTRFGSFVNSHPLGVGGEPKGDIHTNRVLQLFFTDGFYEDPVSARDGFEWFVGADWDNTTFAGGYNESHPEIEMPTVNSIEALSAHSDGALTTLLGGDDPAGYDITVQLNGDSYTLVAREKSGDPPAVLTAANLPFPPDGVVYVDGDIASLSGTLNERITIACTGEITITESIRYVDGNGEPIYVNGLSQDPDNEPYEPNPNYQGNAALGVIANGDILYDHGIPDYLEVNGVFFSATGRFGLPGLTFTADGRFATGWDSSFQKQSFRRLGGLITDLRIVSTVVNSSGTVLSGFQDGHSVYDKRLKSDPPPHFLSINRPLFSSYRVVSGGAPGTLSGEGGTWSTTGMPIGAIERAAYGG